jgi:CO/xanthine dehydrogenase FAD-binding subunit
LHEEVTPLFPTPFLGDFEYVRPRTLQEASEFMLAHAGTARLFMGGTDLFIRMRDGFVSPKYVVDVKHCDGLAEIHYDDEQGLTVGAAVNMNRMCVFPAVRERYPLLCEAAHTVASYQLRTRATMAGNVCNASPAADTVPSLLVLEAIVHVFGPHGRRTVPITGFFLGPGKTVLQPGEIVTAIQIPPPPAGYAAKYIKLGRNAIGDLAIVGVAALGFPGQSSGHTFRIGLASVAPTPLRARAAEAILAAGPLNDATIERAAEAAMSESKPISDVRGSREYRLAMVRALTRRAVNHVLVQLARWDVKRKT